ncbi:cobalt-precorrin-4 C(11)-methyltransferase [ANME-2 cluster archaeon]|nr:MAG: cobalt-precorrin-4 C(11)-methyltransferase [ANME-2 cluster archaeon]
MKVFFIGAGPGDAGLITVRGKELLECADTIIYPGSSINAEILEFSNGDKINSWNLNFEGVVAHIIREASKGKTVVKLHSGDPSLFEDTSMYTRTLSEHGIRVEIIPGVSSLSALAASLKIADRTLIVTRPAGEPWRDDYRFESGSIKGLSSHRAAMVIFIGTKHIRDIINAIDHPPDTRVAVVYHASWDDEEIITGTVADIADKVEEIGIRKSAAIFIKPHEQFS